MKILKGRFEERFSLCMFYHLIIPASLWECFSVYLCKKKKSITEQVLTVSGWLYYNSG